MPNLEPLKSVLPIGILDDTSLALPLETQSRSGEQRVKEQVQTLQRSRSKSTISRSVSSTLSPTSPVKDYLFVDGLKSPSLPFNGTLSFANGFSKSISLDKNIQAQESMRKVQSFRKSYVHHSQKKGHGAAVIGQSNSSRSEPGLAFNKTLKPAKSLHENMNKYGYLHSSSFVQRNGSHAHYRKAPNGTGPKIRPGFHFMDGQHEFDRTQRQTVVDGQFKFPNFKGGNGQSKGAEVTMEEAVEFLSSADQNYQHFGASHIQHCTFVNDGAKKEVLRLGGIPPLIRLLSSSNSQVQQTAASALRNLSFKSEPNKLEIHRCGGIPQAVDQLRDSNSAELDKQLTGLLWNLSSLDSLKVDLLNHALSVLMERVILRHTKDSTQSSSSAEDQNNFYLATGCLRNLSSASQSSRQTMRRHHGLIDSLVSYVRECVDSGKTSSESLTNCVCILHNLTFQLETEAPTVFNKLTGQMRNFSSGSSSSSSVGCFSTQSKSTESDHLFDFPLLEDPEPNGASLLFHSKTLQAYLSLLNMNQKEEIQEACCGILQNLTSQNSIVSNFLSQIIVQKLNGMRHIAPLLKSEKVNVQKSSMYLLGNLVKNPNLHSTIGRLALPELAEILTNGTSGANESDDTLAMACQVFGCLLLKEPDKNKQFLDRNLVQSLSNHSQNLYFPKSNKAASALLFQLWSDKDMHSILKKQGMSKAFFVNDNTAAARKTF